MDTKQKQCVICGKTFIKKSNNQIYCSKKCKAEREKQLYKVRSYTTQCFICGKTFISRTSTAKYCSDACRKEGIQRNINGLTPPSKPPAAESMQPFDIKPKTFCHGWIDAHNKKHPCPHKCRTFNYRCPECWQKMA